MEKKSPTHSSTCFGLLYSSHFLKKEIILKNNNCVKQKSDAALRIKVVLFTLKGE